MIGLFMLLGLPFVIAGIYLAVCVVVDRWW